MKTTVVWFRQDLRISDHPALSEAVRRGRVVPLFIMNQEEEGDWPYGAASLAWLHHSLESLKEDLDKIGLKLILRKGNSLQVLKEVMAESEADALYWSRRYEPASIARDSQIKATIQGSKSFKANLIFEPWEIIKPYKVFTPFYKVCMSMPECELPLPAPREAQGVSLKSLDIKDFELLPRITWDKKIFDRWTPGSGGAQKTLKKFDVTLYGSLRDIPSEMGVSHMSPYLHFGEISPRQIWHALKDKENSATYLRQIIWREFAHHMLYFQPNTPLEPLRPEFAKFPWQGTEDELFKWQKGETGYPIVDAGMRELWHTGWMHNRVRMVVGSFLVKDLLISWVSGAKWFWDTLVDADLANNTFGWQWVAGCGADAAPYFRIFNPTLQGEKFDPEGEYVKTWIPELQGVPKKFIHKPWECGGVKGYPDRIVDHDVARKRALRYKEN